MTKSGAFTTADADRLLGLADQFLEDWGESARRHGECGHDCEERAAEWEAIRPLLASAPKLFAVLDEAESQRQPHQRRRSGRMVRPMASHSPHCACRSAGAGDRGRRCGDRSRMSVNPAQILPVALTGPMTSTARWPDRLWRPLPMAMSRAGFRPSGPVCRVPFRLRFSQSI